MVLSRFNRKNNKLYISVVTLSTQYNTKLLQKLKSSLKKLTDWKRYELKMSKQITKAVFGLPDGSRL